jgi:hypothetical protein
VRGSTPLRSSRVGLVSVILLLLVGGCNAIGRDDGRQPDSDPTDGISEAARRTFRPLDVDQSGGPRHVRPIPAEPTGAELDEAARSGPTRLSAETFAALLHHALCDQTSGSQGDSVVSDFGDDLQADSVASIEETRMFPGDRIVPGGRSWLRSSIRTTSSGTEAVVYVVEKIEAPTSFLSKRRDPWVYWAQATLSLGWSGEEWRLVDYQSAGASENEKFSVSTWRGTMDSGRGWRRFDVAEAP